MTREILAIRCKSRAGERPLSVARCRAGRGRSFVSSFLLGWMVLLPGVLGCTGMVADSRNAEGVRLFQQARYDEALREFQEASNAESENADAYYNLAATYHRLGKQNNSPAYLQMAEHNYNLCLYRNQNHTACYRGLAVLLAEQGRNQEAFRLLEGWVMRQPTVGDAKVELARLCEEYGDKNAAKEHLIGALAVQPENPRALTALGKIQEDSGNTAQALANYQRSLQADNRQPFVSNRVAVLQANSTFSSPGVTGTRMVDNPPNGQRFY